MYNELFKCFHQYNIRYLLCCGLAVNIYGVARMTTDIDILLDFEKENLAKFERCVKDMNYMPLLPLDIKTLSDDVFRNKMLKERNLIAYSFYNSEAGYMNLDILMDMAKGLKNSGIIKKNGH
jgi:hypothetical protein